MTDTQPVTDLSDHSLGLCMLDLSDNQLFGRIAAMATATATPTKVFGRNRTATAGSLPGPSVIPPDNVPDPGGPSPDPTPGEAPDNLPGPMPDPQPIPVRDPELPGQGEVVPPIIS